MKEYKFMIEGTSFKKSDTDCEDDNRWLHLPQEMSQPTSGLFLPADTVSLSL